MRVYENLMFQKKYFPSIYEVYRRNTMVEQEVAVSIEDRKTNYRKDEILCICGRFNEILREVFHVPIEIIQDIEDELDSYNSVIIYDSCEEKVKASSSQGILELYFTTPYFINAFKIRLEKRINKEIAKKAVRIIVIKDLDFFEKMNLKEFEYEIISEDLGKLKNIFLNRKYIHNKKNIMNKLSKEMKEKTLSNTSFLIEKQDIIISMKICKQLSEDISKRNFKLSDLSNILNICMKDFTEKSIEILKTIIIEPNFSINYEIVENYLKVEKNLESTLKKFIETEILVDIKRIIDHKSNTTNTDTYVQLLKSKIILLDTIISDSLDMINIEVNERLERVN